jgi:hypothetical protein
VTHYEQIERWWEIVSSAYLMVGLQFDGLDGNGCSNPEPLLEKFQEHSCWKSSKSWTSRLRNLQLIIEPFVCFCLLKSWLVVFEIPSLEHGFAHLIAILNQFVGWQPQPINLDNRHFSSA